MNLRALLKKERLFLIMSTLLVLLLVYGLFAEWKLLSGVKDFRYPYREFIGLTQCVIPALCALLFIIFFHYGYRKGCSLRHLLFLVIASYLFQLSILAAGPHGISSAGLIVSDPAVTSYFQPASELKSLPLDRYPELMGTFFMHSRTHPPGAILTIRASIWFFDRVPYAASLMIGILKSLGVPDSVFMLNKHSEIAAVFFIGFLIPFLSLLSAFPIYLAVSRFDSRRSAYIAAALFLVAPAMGLFIPEFDQLYSLFTAGAFAFFFTSLERQRALHAFIAGLVLALGVFFHFLCMSIILLFLVFGALWYLRRSLRSAWKEMLRLSSLFAAGFAIPFILLRIIFGFPVILVFQKAAALNRILVQKFPLPGIDFLQFSIFTGVPLFILLFFSLFRRETLRIRRLKPETMLNVSLLVLMIALSISGQVRVETGRLWIFLIPFAASIGGIELERLSNRKFSYLLIVIILIILTTLVLRGKLVLLSSPIYGNF